MKLTTILTPAIALALPMCATSNKHYSPKRSTAELEKIFHRKDQNHDGVLTRQEFTANVKDIGKSTRVFIKKDKDGDDKLTLQEFCTEIPKKH